MPQDQDQDRQISLEEFEEQRRKYYKIPAGLAASLRQQESGGNQYDQSGKVLTSPKQAKGRYQVLQGTADRYGLNASDPFENIEAGFRYLSDLNKQVDSKVTDPGERWAQTLAGYHAGDGRLRETNKTGNLPSTSDGLIRTDEYVSNIMNRWQQHDRGEEMAPLSTREPEQAKFTPDLGKGEFAPLTTQPRPQTARDRKLASDEVARRKATPMIANMVEAFEALKNQGSKDEARNLAAKIKAQYGQWMEVGDGEGGWPYVKSKVAGWNPIQPGPGSSAPSIQEQQAAFEQLPLSTRIYERAADAFARGGGHVSKMARQAVGAGMGLAQGLAGGDFTPVDLVAWRQGEEERMRTLQERQQRRPSNFTTEVAEGAIEGVPAASAAILGTVATGGGMPAAMAMGGGMSAAGADWKDPRRAIAQTAIGAVAPIAGGKLGSKAGEVVAERLARPIAQTAARVGGELVGGGAGNVIGSGAEQLAFDGDLNWRELAKQGVVGAALNVPGAVEVARGRAPVAMPDSEAIPRGPAPSSPQEAAGWNANRANIEIRAAIDRFTQKIDQINRSNLPPSEKAAQIAEARANFRDERAALAQMPQQAPEPAMAPEAAPMAPEAPRSAAPALPPGVRIVRQGEQIPQLARGERRIPMEVKNDAGEVETVWVLAPERINGQRINETMLRPMVEQSLAPQQPQPTQPAPARPVAPPTAPAQPAAPRFVTPVRQERPASQFFPQQRVNGAILAPESSLAGEAALREVQQGRRKLLPPATGEEIIPQQPESQAVTEVIKRTDPRFYPRPQSVPTGELPQPRSTETIEGRPTQAEPQPVPDAPPTAKFSKSELAAQARRTKIEAARRIAEKNRQEAEEAQRVGDLLGAQAGYRLQLKTLRDAAESTAKGEPGLRNQLERQIIQVERKLAEMNAALKKQPAQAQRQPQRQLFDQSRTVDADAPTEGLKIGPPPDRATAPLPGEEPPTKRQTVELRPPAQEPSRQLEDQPVEPESQQDKNINNFVPLRPPAPSSPAGGRFPRPMEGRMYPEFPSDRRAMVGEGRRVGAEIEAGRGEKGQYGKIAEGMYKSSSGKAPHGFDSFFHDPDLKGALGLSRDAEMSEVRLELKKEMARSMGVKADEISLTHISPAAWMAWANQKRLSAGARAKMKAAIERYQKGVLDVAEKTAQTPAEQSQQRVGAVSETPTESKPPLQNVPGVVVNALKVLRSPDIDRARVELTGAEYALKEIDKRNKSNVEKANELVEKAKAQAAKNDWDWNEVEALARKQAGVDENWHTPEQAEEYARIQELAKQKQQDRAGRQARLEEMAKPAAEQPRTVTHDNPDINGKEYVAKTQDGRLIVPNENNKGGVSIVKDRSGKLAESQAEAKPATKAETIGESTNAKESIETADTGRPDESGGGALEPASAGMQKVSGKQARVKIPRGPSYNVKYEIRELSDLQASHHYDTFDPNPKYGLVNDRDYRSEGNRMDVENNTKPGVFEPLVVLSNDPTATNGPPIIMEDGNVLGGNSRTMMLQRLYAKRPEEARAYIEALKGEAPNFNIDPAAVDGFKQPVLVRTVEGTDQNWQKMVTELNVQPGKALTGTEAAAARAKHLSPEAMQFLSDRLAAEGESGTLAKALEGEKGITVFNRLVKDGIFAEGNRNEMVAKHPQTGEHSLTLTAKNQIEQLLIGRLFRDGRQFDRAAPALRAKLGRIAAQLAKVAGTDWDLTQWMPNAIEAAAVSKNEKIPLKLLNNRGAIFEKIEYTPEELAIAQVLQHFGPLQAERAFRTYATKAEGRGQSSMFESGPSRQEVFNEIFGASEPEAAPQGQSKPLFVEKAEQRLRDATSGKLAGSGMQQMFDSAVVAGWHAYRAGMKFAEWSRAVIKQVGDKVKPHLLEVWDKLNKSFSVGSIPNETKGHYLASGFGGLQGGKGKSGKKSPEELTFRERTGRKIGATQTMAQLLSEKVIAANAISNATFAGAKNLANVVALAPDRILAAFTGQRQVAKPEILAQIKDFKNGFIDVYHAVKAKDYASLNDNRYELANERVFKNKVGGFFEDVMNITLRGPDRGAFLAAYNDAVQQLQKAQGKGGRSYSLDQIDQQAKMEAQQAVFQDKNMVSNFTVGLRSALNKITPFGQKSNFGLGDMVGLKYARTPAGLVARGLEYSPLGFASAFYKIGKVMVGKGKGFDQRNASLAFGRAFVGTVFGSGLGAVLRAMGVISQPEQDNRGVQAAERAEGLNGYQLNLSALKRYATGGLMDVAQGKFDAGKKQKGDILMSYDWLQPWAFSIGMGAATIDAYMDRKPGASTLDNVLTQIDAVTSTLTDQSILRNVRDLFKYGPASTGRKILTDAPASFVPSTLNQIRQVIDDRAREISHGRGPEGMAREALDKVLNKLPRVHEKAPGSTALPERKDIVGRSVPSRLEGKGGAALIAIPGRFSKYNPHPVLGAMQETGVGSAGVSRKPGESEAKFRARKALAADWMNRFGLDLATSPAFRLAEPEEKKAAMEYLKRQITTQIGKEQPNENLLDPDQILEAVRKSADRKAAKIE